MTLSEVLGVVGDMYGFDVQRKGNVFHVYPAGLRTETIPVNYLMMSRRGLSRTSVSTGGVASNDSNSSNNNNFDNANGSTNNNTSNRSSNGGSGSDGNGTRIETDTNSDYWTDLRDTLQTLVAAVTVAPSSPARRRAWSPSGPIRKSSRRCASSSTSPRAT